MTSLALAPSIPLCPPWCVFVGEDSDHNAADPVNWHHRSDEHTVNLAGGTPEAGYRSDYYTAVAYQDGEMPDPRIVLCRRDDHLPELTSGEARQLAALLLALADQLDGVPPRIYLLPAS